MIGVCIKYFHMNYGGMLQAYATTNLFEKRNLEYELIKYNKKKNLRFIVQSLPRLLNPILMYDKYLTFSKKIGRIRHPEFNEFEKKRIRQFKQFVSEHFVAHEKVYYGYEELKNNSFKYDAIISGSDQLWSPSGLESNFFNLMFVPDHIKKISLASSFGVSSIPKNQVKRTKQYLSRIPFISVRENQGAEIVKKLTGRDVPVVLDPVFMLNAVEWNQLIEEQKNMINDDYVFAYLLGPSDDHRKKITEFAKGKGLKVVVLRHANQYVEADETFGDICPDNVGPKEFLSLIRHAKYICTDSYHGCVFSVIYKKEFAVFNRYSDKAVNSKNSRIDTLCKNFGLENRRYVDQMGLDLIFDTQTDYETVHTILVKRQQEFNAYLDNALNS